MISIGAFLCINLYGCGSEEKKLDMSLKDYFEKMYKQIREKVNEIKENENYAYSINDFLTEMIEKGLEGNNK